jgi:putative flippase GtrA
VIERHKPAINLSFILSGMSSAPGETPRSPASVAAADPPHRAHVLVQFLKFGIVGVSNTALTFLVYTLLLKVFGVFYLAASAIGFIVGATNGFLLNRRWTFRDHVGDSLTPVRWAIVQGAGLGVNEGLLFLLVDTGHLDKLIAQALATIVVTVTTFFANRAWTFKVHHHEAPVAVADAELQARLP